MGLRPAHRSTPPGPDGTMAMQWALAHHDTAAVRRSLRETRERNGGLPASEDSPPDGVYTDAILYLASGDTTTAGEGPRTPVQRTVRGPDGTLHHVPALSAALRRT